MKKKSECREQRELRKSEQVMVPDCMIVAVRYAFRNCWWYLSQAVGMLCVSAPVRAGQTYGLKSPHGRKRVGCDKTFTRFVYLGLKISVRIVYTSCRLYERIFTAMQPRR